MRSLEEVVAVGRFMAGFPRPWWVGGGWAIDLWAGGQSREHEDIEICVLRSDQGTVRAYCAGWQPFTPGESESGWVTLAKDELLEAPRSMLQLRRTPETVVAIEGMPSTFEFILNDVADGQWFYTFEPSISTPLNGVVVLSPLGLHVTAPEVLLLHKAWYPHRPKDEHDFRRVRARLNVDQRGWLRRQIARIRPDDPWLSQPG